MSGPGEFYASLNRSLEMAPKVAVATIVRTRGSSPREVGARMLIRPDGATDGEANAEKAARQVASEVWKEIL